MFGLESIAGPLLGAGLGLLGGDSGGGTTITRPYIPKDREDAYTRQLKDALKIYETPFDPRPTMRVAYTYPTNQFESLFQNPELGELQRRSDQSYFESLLSPQSEPEKPKEDQQVMADLEARMMARDYFNKAGGTMANPASTRTAQSRMADMYNAGLFDDKQLSDIGRFVQASGGAMDVAGYDRANMKDPKLLENYQLANQAALVEAMRRKAMGV